MVEISEMPTTHVERNTVFCHHIRSKDHFVSGQRARVHMLCKHMPSPAINEKLDSPLTLASAALSGVIPTLSTAEGSASCANSSCTASKCPCVTI